MSQLSPTQQQICQNYCPIIKELQLAKSTIARENPRIKNTVRKLRLAHPQHSQNPNQHYEKYFRSKQDLMRAMNVLSRSLATLTQLKTSHETPQHLKAKIANANLTPIKEALHASRIGFNNLSLKNQVA